MLALFAFIVFFVMTFFKITTAGGFAMLGIGLTLLAAHFAFGSYVPWPWPARRPPVA